MRNSFFRILMFLVSYSVSGAYAYDYCSLGITNSSASQWCQQHYGTSAATPVDITSITNGQQFYCNYLGHQGPFTCYNTQACPSGTVLNQSTGACECPAGKILQGGVCVPITGVCDPASPNFNLSVCQGADGPPCPNGNQMQVFDSASGTFKKTCYSPPADPPACTSASANFLGYVNGSPICNRVNPCAAGQVFGIVNGREACIDNKFAPPACSPPQVLTPKGCLTPAAPPPVDPKVTVTPDNNGSGTTTITNNNTNISAHTGGTAAAGQNGGHNTNESGQNAQAGVNPFTGKPNDNPDNKSGTGPCDPTQPNYAICIGEVQTADGDASNAIVNNANTNVNTAASTYFQTRSDDLNNAGNTVDLSGASAATSFLQSIIPQPASCNSSALSFTVSGHTITLQCSRFDQFKVWFGWFLWLSTVYAIVAIALRPVGEST